MAPATLANWPASEPLLRLPHPYHHTAYVPSASSKTPSSSTSSSALSFFQLKAQHPTSTSAQPTPEPPLHNDSLHFSAPADLKSSDRPPNSNNTAWARARRSPASTLTWDSEDGAQSGAPTLAQAWLVVYALFTLRPEEEFFRLTLAGPSSSLLAAQLLASMLAIPHPPEPTNSPENVSGGGDPSTAELVLLRAAFWQGAGSPFGARSVWVPSDLPGTTYGSQAAPPLTHVLTDNPANGALVWHPRRAPKPRPASVVYSRWIPHLRETFSMVALDHTDAAHVALFHAWQNDPRVAEGWQSNATVGTTAAEHRAYLARLHADPHQFAVLAAFDGVFFAYFEIYWAREDRLGAYYGSLDFDRGRHSLVGDVRYRGAHRVGAWWSSLMHYLFLDDPRTMQVVGEPKFTNTTVLAYDLVHGFGVDKFVDLPTKRSAFMRCSRERFFQICPLAEDEKNGRQKVVAGTQVGVIPKL